MNAIIEAILERAIIYRNVMAAVISGELSPADGRKLLMDMEAHDE
jgi:hypothetical protein